MSSIDSETKNLFKRQRTGPAWKLRRSWEIDRIALMFQANESNHELYSTAIHPTASKRKRQSTEPYIPPEPTAAQTPSDIINDTDMVSADPILYSSTEHTEQFPIMDVQPTLIDKFYIRRKPLFNIQLALKHLITQIELSIELQETSINSQKITVQQLGQSIRHFELLTQQIQ